MATKFYLPSSGAAAVSPSLAGGWSNTSINSYLKCVTAKSNTAMTTVSFTDSDATNQSILFRTYVSDPLAAQTISAQTITAQMRVAERLTGNNMQVAWAITVVNNAGTTKTGNIVLPLGGKDNWPTEATTTLTNRARSTTTESLAINANDRLVFEIGLRGDPSGGGSPDHDSDIRIGDNDASDLPADETTTNDNNPWINFANTITFAGGSFTQTCNSTETPAVTYTKLPNKVLSSTETPASTITKLGILAKSFTETPVNTLVKLISPLSKDITELSVVTFSKAWLIISNFTETAVSTITKLTSLSRDFTSSAINTITKLGIISKAFTETAISTFIYGSIFSQSLSSTTTAIATLVNLIGKAFANTATEIATLVTLVMKVFSITETPISTESTLYRAVKTVDFTTIEIVILNKARDVVLNIISTVTVGLPGFFISLGSSYLTTAIRSISTLFIPGAGEPPSNQYNRSCRNHSSHKRRK